MKNKTYLYLIIALVISAVACKKEQAAPISDEIPTESLKIYRSIKAFEQKVNNGTLFKSDEMIEVDSAIWYSEALQNYLYARPDLTFEHFIQHKTNFHLTVDEALMVPLSDLQALVAYMETQLDAELALIDSDEKHLRFTDVALDSIDGNTAYLSINSVYGKDFPYGHWYTAFQEGEDWMWGTLGQEFGMPAAGMCDGTQYGVSDASDELMKKLNNPSVQYPWPYTFVSLSMHETRGEYYETPEWPYYRLYMGWDYPEQNCLTHDLLNFYLTESHKIIYNYDEGFRPEGKSMVQVYIRDALILHDPYPNNYHNYEVTYGIRVPLPDEY